MSSQTFAELKKSRSAGVKKLTEAIDKLSTKKDYSADETYWSPTVDKEGNGYAVIRFLDSPPGEDLPFVRYWDHGFKGPTGLWYIEKSLTTLGQEDPLSVYNSEEWNKSSDDDSPERKGVRVRKRRLHYVSNVLVVSDPDKPECEGKVYRYVYGAKIFDKLNTLMNPDFPDEEPINPFDLWAGCNFKIKIRKVEGYRNYDKSEFDKRPVPISEDDSEIEKIWRQCHSLSEIIDPKNFKTYDELKKKLDQVLGLDKKAQRRIDDEDDEPVSRVRDTRPSSVKQVEKDLDSEDDDGSSGSAMLARLKKLAAAKDDEIPF